MTLTHDEHSLAAPYALGALDASERRAFAARPATCAACRQEVLDVQPIVDHTRVCRPTAHAAAGAAGASAACDYRHDGGRARPCPHAAFVAAAGRRDPSCCGAWRRRLVVLRARLCARRQAPGFRTACRRRRASGHRGTPGRRRRPRPRWPSSPPPTWFASILPATPCAACHRTRAVEPQQRNGVHGHGSASCPSWPRCTGLGRHGRGARERGTARARTHGPGTAVFRTPPDIGHSGRGSGDPRARGRGACPDRSRYHFGTPRRTL